MMVSAPNQLDEICDVVRTNERVAIVGNQTKNGLCRPDLSACLSMANFSGIIEYEPTEFTITVKAGTTISTIVEALKEHRQQLPFEPMFAERDATIGGTIASGVNGPGRWRHGGSRDFILGVQIVDGSGQLLRGGGKVVKNAAGFDLPKLMVGSCGWIGALTELTLKVFPLASAGLSIVASFPSVESAMSAIGGLVGQPFDLDAVEIVPKNDHSEVEVWIRLVGEQESIEDHSKRVIDFFDAPARCVDQQEAIAFWRDATHLRPLETHNKLIRMAVSPEQVLAIEKRLKQVEQSQPQSISRRYGVGGNVAWLSVGEDYPLSVFDEQIAVRQLGWMSVVGQDQPLGRIAGSGRALADCVKATFDTKHRWASALDQYQWTGETERSLHV